MYRIIKYLLGVFVFCLLVLTIAASVFVLLIEPNDYKNQIASLLKAQIGRDVTLEGDIELSLFPLISVKTGRIIINNPSNFQEQPFLALNGSEIQIKLWPLLYKKIEIAGINLIDLTVNLQKKKQGLNNWEDFSVQNSVSPTNKADAYRNGESTISLSTIGPINIRGGHVNWDNRLKGSHVELKKIQFNSGQVIIGKPFTINASFTIINTLIKSETNLKISTSSNVDEKLENITFSNTHLNYAGYNPLSSDAMLNAGLAVDKVTLNCNSQTLTATGLQLESEGIKLQTDLTVDNVMKNPIVRSAINIAPFSAQDAIKQLGITLPAMSNPKALTDLSMAFNLHATPNFVEIIGLNLKLDESRIAGSMTLKNFNRPSIFFNFTVDEIDVDEYRAVEDKSRVVKGSKGTNSGADAFAEIMDKVKKFDANGQLIVGKLKINHTLFDDVNLKLSSKNGFETDQLTNPK